MRTSLLPGLLCCIVMLAACKRNRNGVLATYSVLVQTIEWKDGSRESWTYNTDDNLERTVGASPTSSAIERDFLYNGLMLGLLQKTSIKEDTFYYNNDRRITRIEEYDMGLRKEGGARLDFTYDAQGKVSRMDYGRYKGSAYTLQAVSLYTWSAEGLLQQIKTSPAGRQEEYVYDFSHENKPFIFNEWAFVNRYHLVDRDYELWNIPVLKSMDRLPKRIGWTKKANGQITEQTNLEYRYTVDPIGRLLRRDAPNGDWMKFTYQPGYTPR